MDFKNGFIQSEKIGIDFNEKRHQAVFPCYIQSVPEGGFLCSPEHGKLCFELLEMFSAAQNNLPLQEAEKSSEVGFLYELKTD